MEAEEFLSKLKNTKGKGNQYTASCPAHEDENPSLSIKFLDDKILLKCHAGCTIDAIMEALGLKKEALFDTPSRQRDSAKVYDYKDLNGNIIHSTVRGDPKTFRQRRPDPHRIGEYIYDLKGVQCVLYNLTSVAKAIKEKEPIIVVEGEKDCDNLAKYGFVATTNALGAGKWRSSYSEALEGGLIYIIPDNDAAGNAHALKVAKALKGRTQEVYMVDMTSQVHDLPIGGDISDFLDRIPPRERKTAIEQLLENATVFTGDATNNASPRNNDTLKMSTSEELLEYAKAEGVVCFVDDRKEAYAVIKHSEHKRAVPINSQGFELWLTHLFYQKTGKILNQEATNRVSKILHSEAIFNNPTPVKLFERVGEHENIFYYDLANESCQAVQISASGWKMADNPPAIFRRFNHQKAQVIPEKQGDIQKVLGHINIKGSKILFLCWIVSCFIPNIPHPILVFHGEKGSAKSTASAILKSLIDPSTLDTLTLQNDQRNMAVNLQNHWFLPFDNVSSINTETSDTLCRAATGGGIQQRKLHTNSDDVIFTFSRCISINGINNVATRADLLDRSILLELSRITESSRKELSKIMQSFDADKPSILVGIFDLLAKAMEIYPKVELKNLPRMADFAKWGYAIAEALEPGCGSQFLLELAENKQTQNEEAVANDVVATLIFEFMGDKDLWSGSYTELYKQLENTAELYGINPKHQAFPSRPNTLSRRITAIASNLESFGIYCTPGKRTRQAQTITIQKIMPDQNSSRAAEIPKNTSPLPHDAAPETRSQQICADDVGGVDKIQCYEDFCTVVDDISDADIPQEFLSPETQPDTNIP